MEDRFIANEFRLYFKAKNNTELMRKFNIHIEQHKIICEYMSKIIGTTKEFQEVLNGR